MWFPQDLVRISGQIEQVDRPTKDVFKRHVASGTPVIIHGALDGQQAWSTWTPDYLKARIGDAECEVYVTPEDRFTGGEDPDGEARGKFAKMKLSDCIERMSTPSQATPLFWPRERYNPYKVPARLFASLVGDLAIPEFIPYRRSIDESNLWMSQQGNITLPHSDFAENLLTQICGRKHILLWDTSQWSNLYLNPLGQTHSRQTQIEITKPDVTRFPLFSQARALEGFLEPGDGLFIPFGYIHCVHSDTFSISVNYWWGGSSLEKMRSTLFSPLFSYCARTPWVSSKLVVQGALRRLSRRTRVVNNKVPAIIETAVRLGDQVQPPTAPRH
jgi:hypothetical protein